MVRVPGKRRTTLLLCCLIQAIYCLAQPEFVPYRPFTGISHLKNKPTKLDNDIIQKVDNLGQIFKSQVRKLRSLSQVDLIFLLDSSASVGVRNFYVEVSFVKKFLSDFTVAYNSTRVALVTFSSSDKVHLQVDHISSRRRENHKCSLLEEQLPQVEYSGGGTYTLGAFLKAEEVLSSSRPSSHKVIFLITDGFSNGGDPVPVATRLKQQNVEIFSLGIENGDPVELRKIASEPESNHSFILDSFKEFEALVRRSLHEDLRPGGFEEVARGRCDRLCLYGHDCCDRHATCHCRTRIGYYACACEPGYYGNGKNGTCQACPANTYRSEIATDRCSPCPDPNQSSPKASTSVNQCTCRQGFRVDHQHRCIPIRCPPLVPPRFGYLVETLCGTALHVACAMRCQPGHSLIGNGIRVCLQNSTWSGVHPTCQAKTCRRLPVPKHGTLRCTTVSLTYGTKCRTVCKKAYTLIGSSERRCMALGIWDGIPAKCRPARCEPLEPLPHATVEPESCSQRSKYGQTCRYVCQSGYTNSGAENSTCKADGSWTLSAEDYKCEDIEPPVLRCPTNITKPTDPSRNVTEVTWTVPEAEDNSGASLSMRVVPAVLSPKWFGIGRTRIWYIAQDRSGNRATCSFDVIVEDNEPPGMDNCHSPDPVVTDDVTASVSWIKPVFIDNAGPPIEVHSSHQPGEFGRGRTMVRYIALDSSNNHQVCEIDVEIRSKACSSLESPANGEYLCRQGISHHCRLVCQGGFGIAISSITDLTCNNGVWTPESSVKNLACSPTKPADEYELNIMVTMTSQLVCEDETLWKEVMETLLETVNTKANAASGTRVGCRTWLRKFYCDRIVEGNEIPRRVRREARYDTSYGASYGTSDFESSDDYYVDENHDAIYDQDERTTTTTAPPVDVSENDDEREKRRVFVRNFGGTAEFSRNDIIVRNDMEDEKEGGKPTVEPGHTELKLEIVMRGMALPDSGRVPTRYMWLVMSRVAKRLKYEALKKQFDMESAGHTFTIEQFQYDLSKSLACGRGSVHRYSQCVLCPPGTFHNTKTDHCDACPLNTYTNGPGMTSCTSCTDGRITLSSKATSEEDCAVSCPTGSYSDTGVEPCTPCAVGSFQHKSGQKYCIPCIRGRQTPAEGSVGKEQCLDTEEDVLGDWDQIPCTADTCLNGGQCVKRGNDVICACADGFQGVSCEKEVNRCQSQPCHNNGTCINGQDDFMCLCPEGFSGRLCETDEDDCSATVCGDHGTCVDHVADFTCQCEPGWTGARCASPADPCLSATCYNHATCTSDGVSALCLCTPGYRGENCQEKIDQCARQPCKNHAQCVDETLTYSCRCQPGFTGTDCSENIDDCTDSPCINGECVDQIAGFICRCKPGYTGVTCEKEQATDFLLTFSDSGTSEHARLTLPQSLTEFTLSFWMRSVDGENQGTPVSYANRYSDNALTLTDYNGFVLGINGEEAVTDVSVTDGRWRHLCVTWSNERGEWRLYMDGEMEETGTDLARGETIEGSGMLVLGQEQDVQGGDFNPAEAFLGDVTLFNVWQTALDVKEVRALRWSCGERGDVLAWGDFYSAARGATRTPSEFCKACGPPVHPQHGRAVWTVTSPQSNVTYSCRDGYKMMGESWRQCLITAQWTGREPRCEVIRCGHPGRLAHGRLVGSEWQVGSSISYQCKVGYWLLGDKYRECDETGRWTGHRPICREIRCPIKDDLGQNIRILDKRQYYRYLDTLSLQCNHGYRMLGSANLTCTKNHSWDMTFPTCVPDLCTETPTISNGRAIWTRVKKKYRKEIEYECDIGYRFHGSSLAVCLNDTWQVPVCSLVKCAEPEEITDGYRAYENVSVGAEVEYKCVAGFEMIGSSRVQCLGSGAWSGGAPECLIKVCRRLNSPHNGWVRYSSRTYNATAYFECSPHFVRQGPEILRCLETGRWNSMEPHCVRAHCEPLTLPEFAIISTNETTVGSRIKVTCHHGYFLVGDKQLQCMASGRWTGKIPSCHQVECPQATEINHGMMMTTGRIHNDTIKYTCKPGFTLRGTANLTCLIDSTWSHKTPTCEQTSCIPEPIPYGNITYNQSHIQYQCHDGYTLIGTEVIACKVDYQWEWKAPDCVRTECKRPVQIKNGYVGVGTINPLVIAYSCQPGYRTIGGREVRCSEGQWSNDPPECVQGCPEPPHIEHGRPIIDPNQYEVGAQLNYVCHDGFGIKVIDKVVCVKQGYVFYWKGRPPVCTIIQCSIPSDRILRGRLISGRKDRYVSGDKLVYKCDDGYSFSTSGERLCKNGTWTAVPDCERLRCPDPEPLLNGSIHGADFFYRGRIFYSCERGFKLNGPNTRICKRDGAWSAAGPLCRRVECPIPDPVPHGNWTIDVETSADAYYACQEGYILFGHANRRCGDNGEWRGEAPNCYAVNCTIPPPLNNARVSYLSTSLHSQAVYECNKGFLIQGHSAATCLANGTWSPVAAHCERISCSQPSEIPNGRVQYTSLKFKSLVTYSCERGFRLVGSRDAYCTWNGRWNRPRPACRPIICPQPPQIPHAVSNASDPFSVGRVVSYHCDTGYWSDAPRRIRCLDTGEWTVFTLNCERVVCPIVRAPHDGTIQGQGRFIGAQIQIHCKAGYTANNAETTLVCQEDGQWSSTIATCELVTCPRLPVLKHGNMYSSTEDSTFGTIVRSVCHDGYELTGQQEIQCLSNQTWSAEPARCQRVGCITPNLPHGWLNNDYFYYRDTARFQCDPGYMLIGAKSLVCEADHNWNGPLPDCRPIKCQEPSDVRNALRKGDSYGVGDVLHYQCEAGHWLSGNDVIQCGWQGEWNGTLPTCRKVTCPMPDSIENGAVSAQSLQFGDTVTYYCNVGYKLIGDFKLTCLENSTWSSESPKCVRIVCRPPEIVRHARLLGAMKKFYLPGQRVGFQCEDTYRSSSSSSQPIEQTCGLDGKWTIPTGVCTMISCPSRPTPLGGRIVIQTQIYGGIIVYRCNYGFRMVGSRHRICQKDGRWSGEEPSCHQIVCPEPAGIQHGDTMGDKFLPGKKVEYRCNIGHKLMGRSTLRCNSTGHWVGDVPYCKVVTCFPPPNIEHGAYEGGKFEYGSTVQYGCNLGYRLSGDVHHRCMLNGTWAGRVPVCVQMYCPLITSLEHGWANSTGNVYGAMAEYGCRTGYRLVGPEARFCSANGEWTGYNPECERVECYELPTIDYGQIQAVSGTSYYYNDTIDVACSPGYVQQNLQPLFCNQSGHWSGSMERCKPVSCGKPKAIENGFMEGDDHTFRARITYRCRPGHRLSGPWNRHCNSYGEWDGDSPKCVPVKCRQLKPLKHGSLSTRAGVYKTIVTYSCNPGYALIGRETSTCRKDGSWSTYSPYCRRVNCPRPKQIENGHFVTNGYQYGSIVKYTCESGYKISGPNFRRCKSSGEWSELSPSCNWVTCSPPPELKHGTIVGDTYYYSSTLQFYCDRGYHLEGSRTLECIDEQTWSHDFPTCVRKFCSKPRNIDNGVRYGNSTEPGSMLRYRCLPAFKLTGKRKLVCHPNGRWSGEPPVCLETGNSIDDG